VIESRIRRVRPGRRALALFASVVLVGGLAGGIASHTGTAHAQGTPTPAAGGPPPPPPPPPPAAPSAPRATPAAPPAPPAPPRPAASPTPPRPAATAKPQAPVAPAAQKPPAAAPAAQKPVVAAAPVLPNTGTGSTNHSSSPLAALAAVFGGLTLLGSSLALRLCSRKG